MSVTSRPATPGPRRPGRPPQTDEEQARARENILGATAQVFAEHGYHGMSVARVLEVAGIARPTFYRYFRNADEALRIVLDRVGDALRTTLERAVTGAEGDVAKIMSAIDAYLGWSRGHRHMLRSLYAGLDDPNSPVPNWRRAPLDSALDLLTREFMAAGRPEPARWLLEVWLNSMEFTCYKVHLETEGDDRAIDLARIAMTRTATGMLGDRRDWERVLGLPWVFEESWAALPPGSRTA